MATQSFPNAALAITDVKDSQNNSVPNGGTTDSTELTLFGDATASTVVTILDNGSPVGTASVTASGTWEKSVAGLSTGAHSFTVRATDGTQSSPWLVNIGASLQLPAPTVIGAVNGELNPVDAVSGARVLVAYSGMATTDVIGLSWDGHDNVVPTQPGSSMGSVTFTVPPSAVAAVLGRAIGVLYAVVRDGNAKPSELLTLRVLPLPESALTAPKIRQAPDDQNLDVTALTGDADLFVPVWPFIAAGQQISLRFEGIKADGSAYDWVHEAWNNLPISSPAEPNTNVKLANLQQLKDASAFRIIFEVSFDDGVTKVNFPIRTLNLVSAFTLPLSLNGLMIREVSRPVSNPPHNTFAMRAAQWGTGPYRYSTDNPSVIELDVNSGTIISNRNGGAWVTATDATGKSLSYWVGVSNVYGILFGSFRLRYHSAAVSEAGARGGRLLSHQELEAYLNAYNRAHGWGFAANEWIWTSTIGGDGHWEVLNTSTHSWATLGETGWGCVVVLVTT